MTYVYLLWSVGFNVVFQVNRRQLEAQIQTTREKAHSPLLLHAFDKHHFLIT